MELEKKQKPKVLDSKWLNHTRLFHVEQQHLEFTNGEQRVYERLNPGHHRAVMVVAMLDSETVLLVREYGAGISEYYLSLPKGAMDDDEDVLLTANRELMEEAGYGAEQLEVITELTLSPSYMGNFITIVLAQGLYEKRLPGDEPEQLDVIPYPLSRLDELIACEDFSEAYAVAALYMVRDRLKVNEHK